MYVVCSKDNNKDKKRVNGQIANTVFQVTSDPPTLAVSINKNNLTYEFIEASKVFTLSVLAQDAPLKLIGQFGFKSGRDINKFEGVNYKLGKNGVPVILESTVAYFELEQINKVDAGTHVVFIGKVIEAEVLNSKEPMTYAYYHNVKQGTTPKNAATFISNKEESKQMKYQCKVCGYVYDPEKGDPDAGIQHGTAFDALPADWICPICGAGKDQFELVLN